MFYSKELKTTQDKYAKFQLYPATRWNNWPI